MTYESLNEPIGVAAVFRPVEKGPGATLHPLSFQWQARAYRVDRVTYSWRVREGAGWWHHFTVTTRDGNTYELAFHTESLCWQLTKVWLP